MKNILKWLGAWALVMTCAWTLTACGGDDADDNGGSGGNDVPQNFSIVGSWRIYFYSNDSSRGQVYNLLTFNSNRTGTLVEEVGYGSDRPNPFTWMQSGKTIRISFTEENYSFTVEIVEVVDNSTIVVNTIVNGRQGNYTVYRDSGNSGGGGGGNDSTTVQTPNTGTVDNPLSASQIYDIVAAMPADDISADEYCVKGRICSIKYPFSAEYGTAVFSISDNGQTAGKVFTVYSTYYKAREQGWTEGDTQIALDDEVVVFGKVVNYRGTTPEFAERQSYLVTLNGVW